MTSGTRTTGGSMAKRSLAQAAKGYTPKGRGYETWDVLLRQRNPSRMEEIESWIDEWESGGCRDVFDTRNSLALFIIKHTDGLVKNTPPVIKYMQRRANGKPSRSK